MRSIKDMLVLYGLAFIIAMFGLWLIFQTDSGQYLLDDTVPLSVVTPEQCTERMHERNFSGRHTNKETSQ